MKKTNEVYSTPKRIGTMKNGKRKIGVAGYGLEEILNGGRMFHERPKGFPAFHVEALALEKMVDDKWKRFEIKDSFLSRPKKLLKSRMRNRLTSIMTPVSTKESQRSCSYHRTVVLPLSALKFLTEEFSVVGVLIFLVG